MMTSVILLPLPQKLLLILLSSPPTDLLLGLFLPFYYCHCHFLCIFVLLLIFVPFIHLYIGEALGRHQRSRRPPGRLKMQDRKMTDRKMTDKSAGLENAGLENDPSG